MGTRCSVLERRGSHLLISREGRFGVVEARNGRIYNIRGRKRREFPETESGMAAAVGRQWTDEATARRAFDAIAMRGEDLAQRMW